MTLTFSRYVATAGLAFGVTFALFYLMQVLISTSGTLDTSGRSRAVDFIRLKKEPELEIKKRKLPNKKPPDEPPPPPQLQLSLAPKLGEGIGSIGIGLDIGLDMAGEINLGVAASDTDATKLCSSPQSGSRSTT